jgi:hypothetical protein
MASSRGARCVHGVDRDYAAKKKGGGSTRCKEATCRLNVLPSSAFHRFDSYRYTSFRCPTLYTVTVVV